MDKLRRKKKRERKVILGLLFLVVGDLFRSVERENFSDWIQKSS